MNNICDTCGLPFERTSNSQKRHKGECFKEYARKYFSKYSQTPKYKEDRLKSFQTPEYKEAKRKYQLKYRQTPKYKYTKRKYAQLHAPPSIGTINFLQILSLKKTIKELNENNQSPNGQ